MLFISIFAKVNFEQGNACHVLQNNYFMEYKNYSMEKHTFNKF